MAVIAPRAFEMGRGSAAGTRAGHSLAAAPFEQFTRNCSNFVRSLLRCRSYLNGKHSRTLYPKEREMKKATVFLLLGLAVAANSPAFARVPRHYQPSVPAYSAWQAPYDLPAGPNDVPFAPF